MQGLVQSLVSQPHPPRGHGGKGVGPGSGARMVLGRAASKAAKLRLLSKPSKSAKQTRGAEAEKENKIKLLKKVQHAQAFVKAAVQEKSGSLPLAEGQMWCKAMKAVIHSRRAIEAAQAGGTRTPKSELCHGVEMNVDLLDNAAAVALKEGLAEDCLVVMEVVEQQRELKKGDGQEKREYGGYEQEGPGGSSDEGKASEEETPLAADGPPAVKATSIFSEKGDMPISSEERETALDEYRAEVLWKLLDCVEDLKRLNTVLRVHLMQALEMVRIEPGETVFRQGVTESCLWALLKGKVSVSSKHCGIIFRAADLGPGQVFGALNQEKRMATVEALEPSILLKVTGEQYGAMALDQEKRKVAEKRAFFDSLEWLAPLKPRERRAFEDFFTHHRFEHNQVLCSENERLDSFMLIKKGTCRLLRGFLVEGQVEPIFLEADLLQAKNFMGEAGLNLNDPSVHRGNNSATVVAVQYADVYTAKCIEMRSTMPRDIMMTLWNELKEVYASRKRAWRVERLAQRFIEQQRWDKVKRDIVLCTLNERVIIRHNPHQHKPEAPTEKGTPHKKSEEAASAPPAAAVIDTGP
ncbi:unnamed protein product [Chrysoparadoxa australica]